MMKSKLMFGLFCVLMLALTIGGAMAYFDWQQGVSTDTQTGNNSKDNMIYSYPMNTKNFTSNCTISTGSRFQDLTDNLTHTIWIQGTGVIDLYDADCNLLYEKAVNGTNFGGGFIFDYDHDGKPNDVVAIKTPDNTISLASYEWDGNVLTNDKTIDLGSGVRGCSGVYCDRSSDVCALFCNDGYIRRVNMTANTTLLTSSPIGIFSMTTLGTWNVSGYSVVTDLSPVLGMVSGGDYDGDGNVEALFYTMNTFYSYVSGFNYYGRGFSLMLYDLVGDVVDTSRNSSINNDLSCHDAYNVPNQAGSVVYVGSPAVISRSGFPNSVPKIFYACAGGVATLPRIKFRVYDSSWNLLHNIVDYQGTADYRISNFATGDYNGDGKIEYCIVSRGNQSCYDSTYAEIGKCAIPDYISESMPSGSVSLNMVNYSGDSTLELVTAYGIRDLSCNLQKSMGSKTGSDFGIFLPVDLTNDNKLDFIYQDSGDGMFLNTGTGGGGGTNCTRATCPYPNCQFYDTFNYTCAVNSVGWNVANYPTSDIIPTDEKLCYGGDLLTLQDWDNIINFYNVQINEFDLNVSGAYDTTKQLVYYDSTDHIYKQVWWLDFWADGSISYTGNGSGFSLCSNCVNVGSYDHFKVTTYLFNTNGAQFYNQTKGGFDYIQPNTFSIVINNDTAHGYYNLPLNEPLISGHSNTIWGVNYSWNGQVCIDNEILRGDLNTYGNETGCSNGFDYYTYPIEWMDTFPYADSIMNHGWLGYSWVIGDNPYDTCNMLFMDANISHHEIAYILQQPINSDFVLKWDMLPESSIGNNSYIPNGMPVDFYLMNATGDTMNPMIHLEWGSDGVIYNHPFNASIVAVGNWQGSFDSYKIVMNMSAHTFDFYYTNSTDYVEFILGCDDCAFKNNGTSIAQVSFVPQPEITGNWTYTSVGVWLDNFLLTMGTAEIPPEQDVTNYCNFDGCIFYDHFNYTDDTYAHGWYMFNTTPVSSVARYQNSTQGYSFDHQIDTIYSAQNGGIFSAQFKVLFPTPPESALDLIHFQLWTPEYTRPIDLEFSNGIIFDVNRGVSSLGSYSYNSWNTFTLLVNLQTATYDLYMNSNQLVNDGAMPVLANSITRGGFWVNTNSSIYIDYISLAEGTILVDTISGGGIVSETGVPIEDLKWCWSSTNGSFDWSCCSAEENATKSMLCPARTTFRYALGGITNFVLSNFVYFLIIVIIFVIVTPYIAPRFRGDRR